MRKKYPVTLSLLCGVIATSIPASLFAQTANNWQGGASGNFGDADNWVDGAPAAGKRSVFRVGVDGVASTVAVGVDAGSTYSFGGFGLSAGTDITVNMGAGSTLNALNGGLNIAAGYGGTSANAASLTFSATNAANVSTFNLVGQVQVGGHASFAANGNSLTFTGQGLRVNSSGSSEIRVGIVKNNNILTVSDGAQWAAQDAVLFVGRTSDASGSVGNNNQLIVTGANSLAKITSTVGGGTALRVGSYAVETAHFVDGNRVDVTDGGVLEAVTLNAASVDYAVRLGAVHRATSSEINVSGAGSRLNISAANGRGMQIGYAGATGQGLNVNTNNGVTVSNGGVIKNEGSTLLTATDRNSANYLRVSGAGSAYRASEDITNRGGNIYAENGGAIIGETIDGSAAKNITINLIDNGAFNPSSLYAEGDGLGASVNVNAQANSLISLGNAANGSATALNLNSSIVMAEGSTLQFVIFADSYGSIDFGATGSLSGATTLAISFVGYTARAGDEWTLFSGNTAGIDASFLLATSSLPTLADGLSWDLSRLNEEGDWMIGVVPEPATSAMMIGGCVLAVVLLIRRRMVKKAA